MKMFNFFKKKEEKLTDAQRQKLNRLLADLEASTEQVAEAVRNGEMKVPRLALGENFMRQLKPGWDGYSADVPNKTSFYWAEEILQILEDIGFYPDHITPSVEGGIGISFINIDLNRYADIECFNSGEILAVISDRKSDPDVLEVSNTEEAIISALRKIHNTLASSLSGDKSARSPTASF